MASILIALPLYGACSITYLGTSSQQQGDAGRIAESPLAPDPTQAHEAVVQIYGARVAKWHGYFGVHTWIAAKRRDADHFVVYEVTRDQLLATGSAVLMSDRTPDEFWYGNAPELLQDVRGSGVDEIIDRIEIAVRDYPFAASYHIWPGPNSNTFVAHVLRAVPQLRADLPATAVGKDYLGMVPLARTPSGTGGQINAFGMIGATIGWEEGIELNLLGLTVGVDPNSFALKLPLLGRVGPQRQHSPRRIESVSSGR